jgi:hypothetical protein
MVGEESLRREISRTLEVNLSDDLWAWLVAHGEVKRITLGSFARLSTRREPILDLISGLRDRLRTFGSLQPRTFEVLTELTLEDRANIGYNRHAVLALLAARDAAGDEEVQLFRGYYLMAGPLDGPRIESWIIERYGLDVGNAEGPTWWLGSVPLDDFAARQLLQVDEDHPKSLAELVPRAEIPAKQILEMASWRLLAYGVPTATPGQMEERKIPIVADGTLEELQRLSTRLAKQYGWTEPEATTFVVTGLPPLRPPINVWTEHNERLLGLAVIHLAVDPGMSPKEVGDAYLEARKRLLGTRYRDLSEKHLALAIFVATQSPQLSWAERMDRWNRRYADRDWAYSQVANFSHDCLQAQRRLLRSEAPIVGPAEDATRTPNPSRNQARDDSEEARHVETWAK